MSETETPDLEGLAQRIEKMRAAPDVECIKAAKRLGIKQGMLDGWVSWSPRDCNNYAEGTWNHWQWLSAILLGLVDAKDRPYVEDKPLPDFAATLRWAAAEIARERARADAAEAEAKRLNATLSEAADYIIVNGSDQAMRKILRRQIAKREEMEALLREAAEVLDPFAREADEWAGVTGDCLIDPIISVLISGPGEEPDTAAFSVSDLFRARALATKIRERGDDPI